MAYEFLKKLFPANEDGSAKALTYDELEAAIDASKDLKLVNLAEGSYVAKSKFDDKVTELAGVKKQLTDAHAEIQSFKDQDVDGIKQKVTEWETKYATDTQALKDQMAEQARNHAEEMFLSGYKFSSKAARNGILSELRGKKFQIDESGTILGGKEFMQSLMENEDYKGAFITEQPQDTQQQNGGQAGPRFSQGTGQQAGGQVPGGENPFAGFGGFHYLRQPKQTN